MDKQLFDGIGHRLKGSAKAGLGRLLGDAKLVADGDAERALGVVQSGAARAGGPVTGVDSDRLKGIGHQLRGAARQGVGDLIGDAKLQADGLAERSAGRAQNAIGSARDEAREAIRAHADPAADDRRLP